MYQYFKVISNTKNISKWKSKGLYRSDNCLSPLIDYPGNKIRLKFNGGCLKQQKNLTYTHGTIVDIYIVYELGTSSFFSDGPTLKNSLFGAVKLTKNAVLISIDIPVIEFDLIESQVFHFREVDLVKM